MKRLDSIEKMMDDLVGIGDGEHCHNARPLFVQCACGKWQIQMFYDNNVTTYLQDVFDSRMEAALFFTDLMDLLGAELRKTTRLQ